MKKILTMFVYLLLAAQVCHAEKIAPIQIECEFVPIYRERDAHVSVAEKEIDKFFGTSTNWSGYAAATNLNTPAESSVSKVLGTWVVPTVSATSKDAYSSIWVGIDGYKSDSVQQLGTEQDWIGGEPQYYVWYEMYPKPSFLLSGFPIEPGDVITAKVVYKGNGVFRLSIYNKTQNVFTVIPQKRTVNKNAKRSSAEWIVEAPSDASGILLLADFGVANLSNCQAVINGIKGAINDSNWENDPITLQKDNIVKAVPSALSSSGKKFSVTWQHK